MSATRLRRLIRRDPVRSLPQADWMRRVCGGQTRTILLGAAAATGAARDVAGIAGRAGMARAGLERGAVVVDTERVLDYTRPSKTHYRAGSGLNRSSNGHNSMPMWVQVRAIASDARPFFALYAALAWDEQN